MQTRPSVNTFTGTYKFQGDAVVQLWGLWPRSKNARGFINGPEAFACSSGPLTSYSSPMTRAWVELGTLIFLYVRAWVSMFQCYNAVTLQCRSSKYGMNKYVLHKALCATVRTRDERAPCPLFAFPSTGEEINTFFERFGSFDKVHR